MRYYGKTIDTFEGAVLQLLEYNGVRKLRNLDCISLRAFGFYADDAQIRKLRPFIDTEKAVKALRQVADIPVEVFPMDEEKMPGKLPEAFVLGPVKEGIAAASIGEYYYQGDGRYLFAHRVKSRYEVFDPYGFPGLWMTYEEMLPVVEYGKSCCIYFEKFGDDDKEGSMRHLDPAVLLRRGLMYHEAISGIEKKNIEAACSEYVDSQSNRIALQYGVLNMIQMFDKVSSLAGEFMQGRGQAEYVRRKQQLYHMARIGKIQEFPEMLSYIWRSFE